MKIDLYLENINQEMIRVGEAAVVGCDWYASWTKSCCILDFKGPKEQGYFMRKEPEGALLWVPRTGAVYKLDEEGYHALLDLEHGDAVPTVAKQLNAHDDAVHAFTSRLRELRLL